MDSLFNRAHHFLGVVFACCSQKLFLTEKCERASSDITKGVGTSPPLEDSLVKGAGRVGRALGVFSRVTDVRTLTLGEDG